ncbi:beta strand repeat-containing protein [Mongoliitalea daihaiensis]|uniref:beta strand repeat-containing protein n=1 Tax=Mongoliitalea daihaiensis TaxID=2782006 RepID=UPI001F48B374|nr:hypothetical protein [Mongoliitalea daihaiensis]UJP65221.1 hypothetical protein IPZ59_00865 [Mongoliitalea daihaiensis]
MTFTGGVATIELTLTATGLGTCGDAVDTMILTISENPAANAGADDELCIDEVSYTLAGATAVNGTVQWSTSGSGSFDDVTGINAVYTPSAADFESGQVQLTITVTGAGGTATDTMVLTLYRLATSNAGPDAVIAAGSSYTLSGATATNFGTVTWSAASGTFNNANALNPTFTPDLTALTFVNGEATVTLTLTATGLGTCGDAVDTMILTISENPAANAGADDELCIDEVSYTLAGATAVNGTVQWSTSGSGSFDDVTAINAVYTPSAADFESGQVQLTITVTGAGGTATDTMVLTLYRLATSNAGPDAVIAAGSSYTLSGATASNFAGLTWSAASGTFNNANALNATYTPDLGSLTFTGGVATVELTLTATGLGTCGDAVDTMILTISENPAANAGADDELCIDEVSYTLAGATAVNGTVQWSTSGSGSFDDVTAINAVYTPSAADFESGQVQLTITVTGAGGTATDTMVLTLYRLATSNAGPDAVIAAGSSYTLSGATASNFAGLTWSAASGTFNNANALNATYTPDLGSLTFTGGVATIELTLTATGLGTCGDAVDTMILTISENPAANAGADDELCIDEVSYTLAGATAVNGTVQWSTSGSGSFDDVTAINAVYTPSAADFESGQVQLTITVTGAGGTATDTMVLTLYRLATSNAGPDAVIAAGSSYTLSGATASNFAGLTWSAASGTFNNANALNATYTPDLGSLTFTGGVATIELTLTATGLGTCGDAVDTMVLTISENPAANAGADDELCIDEVSYTLAGATAVNGTVQWSTSGSGSFDDVTAINAVYTPSAADFESGQVQLTITVTGAGGTATDTMVLTLYRLATSNAGPDAVIAAGSSYTLSGATASNFAGLTWSAASGTFNNANALNATYTPDLGSLTFTGGVATIELTLTATGLGTCGDAVDTMVLTISENPAANAGADDELCIDEVSYTLAGATAVNGTVQWSTSGSGSFDDVTAINAVYTPSAADFESGQVQLTITVTGAGGTATDTMVLTLYRLATSNAGPDAVIAAGSSFTLSGATATNFGTVTWSAASGTFNNANALNPTFTPDLTALTFVNGEATVTLTLTASGLGTCGDAVDTMILTISENPAANAGADDELYR